MSFKELKGLPVETLEHLDVNRKKDITDKLKDWQKAIELYDVIKGARPEVIEIVLDYDMSKKELEAETARIETALRLYDSYRRLSEDQIDDIWLQHGIELVEDNV